MNPYRISALLMLVLFALALVAPAIEITEAGPVSQRHIDLLRGFRVLEFGWLGPLQLSIAWYANLPLAVSVVRMLRSRPPGFKLSRVAACLAVTALFPFALYSEVDGWQMALLRGPAIWLWLAVFGLLFANALYAHRQTAFSPSI